MLLIPAAATNKCIVITSSLASHQSAYRKYHFTENLLLRVTLDLISHLDQSEVALSGRSQGFQSGGYWKRCTI